MANSIFDDGSRVLQREVNVENPGDHASMYEDMSDAAYAEVFEIVQTISLVKQHQFKRVALQLPDELLDQSWRMVQRLKANFGKITLLLHGSWQYSMRLLSNIFILQWKKRNLHCFSYWETHHTEVAVLMRLLLFTIMRIFWFIMDMLVYQIPAVYPYILCLGVFR
uniref:Uncharacterized protein n=1 Tax=Aplanochytrium stocchinoi TaxID=215587 RepID=A0A7S3PGQ0_9STRA